MYKEVRHTYTYIHTYIHTHTDIYTHRNAYPFELAGVVVVMRLDSDPLIYVKCEPLNIDVTVTHDRYVCLVVDKSWYARNVERVVYNLHPPRRRHRLSPFPSHFPLHCNWT